MEDIADRLRSKEGEMAKHTPGPWGAITTRKTGRWIIVGGPAGRTLASLPCLATGTLWEEDAANARLIAAAPELLAMLKRAHAVLRGPLVQEIDTILVKAES